MKPVADHGLVEHSHVGGRDVGIGSHTGRVGSIDPADHPVPTGKEEEWRFTPLRRLRGIHDETPLTGVAGTDFEIEIDAPEVVGTVSLGGAAAESMKGLTGYQPVDRVSARAWACSSEVFLVDVPANTELTEPVRVTVRGLSVENAIATHLVIRVGHHARAQVVVDYVGSATLAENVEIIVGDGATLLYASQHDWAADTVHLSHHRILVGRDATVKHAALTFGGDLVRIVASATYAGTGGDAELLGLYFADAGQHLEHRLLMDHEVANCKSRALYKGALQGKGAHTVWVGDVLIRATGFGTDTYETNRNLLLTEGSRADSVPNLEIETGEIAGAGHASATGRFDDEQLFYFLSRGIPESVARRLVVRGFFGEVLSKIGIESVVEHANDVVERELAITGI
ncbi:Fe-S cluster assembly protein SufD [Nakamurella antarctica]|uniref:Fe-S cluster assembly protein SufD n=1 Tax=Nakamurella antarctica TaxID=1902245 RepID=A0A3G8ZRU4_9ACTN|nr:Fe-S cluster assembly protein SufD [Nakamurella antarctica]